MRHLALLLLFMTTGCASGATGSSNPSGEPAPPSEVWGRVWRILAGDTIPIGNPTVWTATADGTMILAASDSTGYWQIGREVGLPPGEYVIQAEKGGIQGSRAELQVPAGANIGPVNVYLGLEDVPLPPIEFEYDGDVGSDRVRVRGRVRCCRLQPRMP